LILVGDILATGDIARVAAGGTAMSNPTIAQVNTIFAPAKAAIILQSNLKGELDVAEEAIDALMPEADKVVRKIYDEVETHFNEEEPESMRADARDWGVEYITKGPPAVLTGLVRTGAGAPHIGATVVIAETGAEATTNAEGRYTLETSVISIVTIQATVAGVGTGQQPADIPEHEDGINLTVADIVIG